MHTAPAAGKLAALTGAVVTPRGARSPGRGHAPDAGQARPDLDRSDQGPRAPDENTIDDKLDVTTDPSAPDEIATLRRRFGGGRYKAFTTNSTYFFFLNHRLAAFDREAVREAVNYALDERALRRIFGGLLDPCCNFLPPGLAG